MQNRKSYSAQQRSGEVKSARNMENRLKFS